MTEQNTPLRPLKLPPSIVVTGGCSIAADIHYEKLEESTETESLRSGTVEATTKTTKRTIRGVEEYDAALKVRSQINTRLYQICRSTVIGPLCPQTSEADLVAAIADMRRAAAAHNASAIHHKIRVSYLPLPIVTTNEAAAREIAADLRAIVEEFKSALDAADVERIREIAVRAKAISSVVGPKESEIMERAVAAARKAATTITREVTRKGNDLAEVRAQLDLSPIDEARAMFLELDIPAEVKASVGMDLRDIEFDVAAVVAETTPTETREIELEALEAAVADDVIPNGTPESWEAGVRWLTTADLVEVEQRAIDAIKAAFDTCEYEAVVRIADVLPIVRSDRLRTIQARAIARVVEKAPGLADRLGFGDLK